MKATLDINDPWKVIVATPEGDVRIELSMIQYDQMCARLPPEVHEWITLAHRVVEAQTTLMTVTEARDRRRNELIIENEKLSAKVRKLRSDLTKCQRALRERKRS